MKEQYKLPRTFKKAATATTLAAVAVAVTAAPSVATPLQASAQVVNGVLVVHGTNAADQITLDFGAELTSSAATVTFGDGRAQRFDATTFRSASVFLGAGDDAFHAVSGGSTQTDVPLYVAGGAGNDSVAGGAAADVLDGGTGNDSVLGGAGNDLVLGGLGADLVDGGVGTDTELLGSGDDVALWNPGEGNDAIEGGRGADTLVFNGSDGAEQMSLAASGQHAVFLRNLGNIRMDLNDVERLDLATLGGADTVTVGDLSGTDIAEADIHLSAASGAGDGAVDTVVVAGSNAADHVDVAADAGAVAVNGLAARTVISGMDTNAASKDKLQVSTGDGDDRVAASDAARALVDLVVDLGTGQR
ncbi:calcium-binding protein [Nocardioides marmorisolisilvae]|uniref:Calcium-binding protein n=1 Tax=Nocardioides marmorisolisilvae TaxID=1542737 RepID=A0A3N0DTS2_9ACTN|nr:hypothetical protein [Nocardioides marmorisolisilvae]RNL79019.1 hypothetical protein EFL95_08215 [Nocardioides marmorisolisilvae]